MVKSPTLTFVVGVPPPIPQSITATASTLNPIVGQLVTVNGFYLNSLNQGIPGATLYVFLNGVQQMTTTTGADGSYTFTFSFTAAGTDQVDIADNPGNT